MRRDKKHTNIDIKSLLEITERLNHIKDLDSLLERILLESRKFTGADAGSIFLNQGGELHFSYVQNESMDKLGQSSKKQLYSRFSVPINENSIAGYVGYSGESLNIPDVYELSDKLPYSFNQSFDKKTSYRTQSMLVIPLKSSRDSITGVIQIINALDENDNVVPFTEDDKLLVTFFANNAAVAVERARMTREIILRMIKMAELRDPKETGSHVNRVASYTIEIYEKWATKKNVSDNEIRKFKDILRIAAMLHDVGKVAISDTILKKPAKLDNKEFEIMKTHTLHGGKLFADTVSKMDELSKDVAETHHEKWDGTGYPRQLKGEEIPLAGRITALADVYDALISKRAYKEAWDEQEVRDYIDSQTGKHFDPEIVEAFNEIYDIIKAIRNKYPD